MKLNALMATMATAAAAGMLVIPAAACEQHQSQQGTAQPGSAMPVSLFEPSAPVEHRVGHSPVNPVPETSTTRRAVDLAIALDTSGSMNGLIDAARQKIWEIVNDLALARPTPDLRVALLTYGNNGHDAQRGWVHVQTDFTDDLDLVSQILFSLTTNGGEEYVGRVLHAARQDLAWHESDDALKLIIVAGNESADQDPVISFRDACRETIGLGIMINSIYCGNPADQIAPGWREVATLSDGQFAAIDQNEGTVVISTPFDEELAMLSSTVNETYIPFTAAGQAAWQNQAQQDANAASMNGATVAARAQTKCGSLYKCESWDLVDACNSPDFDLASVEESDLPAEMKEMTEEERLAYVQEKAARRAEIQSRIGELGEKRQSHIEQQMKQQAIDGSKSLDFVVKQAVRAQAESKGFVFEKATASSEAAAEGASQPEEEGGSS